MRKAHYLRKNDRNESVSQFVCFDTETQPETLPNGDEIDHLWFGYACYQRTRRKGQWCKPQWLRFTSREEFWQWVVAKTAPGKTLYLFCHNTNYDLPVLSAFRCLREMGWKLDQAIIDAPPTILRWRKGKATIKCLDTLNWWRESLAEVGKMVGCPKLPMPAREAGPEEWEEYGKNDTEILRRVMLRWWQFLTDNDLGNFRPTLASQALGSYKHRFMTPKMLVHEDTDLLKMERASYHGGRCECFRIGKHRGQFTLLDVNSMYPAVMRDHVYPVRLHWKATRPDLRSMLRHLDRWPITADVTIQTDSPAYAMAIMHKLVFPVGRFRTVLTTGELRRAASRGEILEVHQFARYEPAPCFRDFVEWFYAKRMDALARGDKTEYRMFKTLMNSLYGKFGQTGRVWSKHEYIEDERPGNWTQVDVDTGKVVKYRQLAGLVQCFEEQPESAESIPAIAAHVTANARLLLWQYIERAGRENVYYCDTDSLLVNETGRDRLADHIDALGLGKLKVEYECDEVELWGPKDYRFGDKVRHKGIRGKAVQVDAATWKQWQWSSLVGMLRQGDMEHPRRHMVTKTLKRNYDKGKVLPSKRVIPLRIDDTTPPIT